MIEGLGVIDVKFLTGQGTDSVIKQIVLWQLAWGDDIAIRADGSHPYNNRELYHHGYSIRQIHGDKGNQGKDNVARWLGSGLLKIRSGMDMFVQQLKNLRRDMASGKQIKKNKPGERGDHGPDALRMALTYFDYVKWYKRVQTEKKKREAEFKKQLHKQHNARRSGRALPMSGRSGSWRGKNIDSFLGW